MSRPYHRFVPWLMMMGGCDAFSPAGEGPPPPPLPPVIVPDAPPADGPGPDAPNLVTVQGTVCVLPDVRLPSDCQANADFTDVVLRQVGTTTTVAVAADGSFALELPAQSLPWIEVTGPNLATSLARPSATSGGQLLAMPRANLDEIIANADVVISPAQATAVLYSRVNGVASIGAIVTGPAGSASLYETLAPLVWTNAAGSTGDSGAAIVGNVAAGLQSFQVDLGPASFSVNQVPMVTSAVSFIIATP